MSTWEPEREQENEVRQPELEAPLASKSTNAGFKRKKIRSMKKEADKIAEKLRESERNSNW